MIIAHTGPLIGVHADFLGIPSSRVNLIGGWAVNMFFAISGFLIAHSAQRGTAAGYLKRRALRIFPGYWVSILFVVFRQPLSWGLEAKSDLVPLLES